MSPLEGPLRNNGISQGQYMTVPHQYFRDKLSTFRNGLFQQLSHQSYNSSVGLASDADGDNTKRSAKDPLIVLLPLLIVLATLLFLLLLFLICVLILRRRRGIQLGDSDGPIDMSREELDDVGFESLEQCWLESVDEETQRSYRRAKGAAFLVFSLRPR